MAMVISVRQLMARFLHELMWGWGWGWRGGGLNPVQGYWPFSCAQNRILLDKSNATSVIPTRVVRISHLHIEELFFFPDFGSSEPVGSVPAKNFMSTSSILTKVKVGSCCRTRD